MTARAQQPTIQEHMPVTIPSAALREMSKAERDRVLDAAFEHSPEALANYVAVLEARLRVFERRYEMSSAALPAALSSGQLRDTADVSEWLFWARLRSNLAGKARP